MCLLVISIHAPQRVLGEISMDNHYHHAGHTRKASRISKAVVDNCGKRVGNFHLP